MGRFKNPLRRVFVWLKYIMPTFITPYSGQAELTAGTGLTVTSQGRWTYSLQGYNDSATFGLSLGYPSIIGPNDFYYGPQQPNQVPPQSGGTLSLSAVNWPIAVIGNELTDYTDPDTGITYPASQCRILVTGYWEVIRQQNSNSFNGQGVMYSGSTQTNLGGREMNPYLLSYTSQTVSYVIQGADVAGGARDTFSDQVFSCDVTESATTDNSNKEFQSNTITRPSWIYTYAKSWQID